MATSHRRRLFLELRRFRKVPSLIVGAVVAAVTFYALAMRPFYRRWGASRSEAKMPLPGDDIVPVPKLESTHAITIKAPTSQVWPWLMQIGQGRGGFYSYDWLENLFGLHVQSAKRIHAELQNLQVGDVVPLAPNGYGPPVIVIEPNQTLVTGGGGDFAASWVFILKEQGATTRLLVRLRLDWKPNILASLAYRVLLEPAHFLMERKMLLGIRERVETYPFSDSF